MLASLAYYLQLCISEHVAVQGGTLLTPNVDAVVPFYSLLQLPRL
jgi:hypothetical protein